MTIMTGRSSDWCRGSLDERSPRRQRPCVVMTIDRCQTTPIEYRPAGLRRLPSPEGHGLDNEPDRLRGPLLRIVGPLELGYPALPAPR